MFINSITLNGKRLTNAYTMLLFKRKIRVKISTKWIKMDILNIYTMYLAVKINSLSITNEDIKKTWRMQSNKADENDVIKFRNEFTQFLTAKKRREKIKNFPLIDKIGRCLCCLLPCEIDGINTETFHWIYLLVISSTQIN